MMAWIQKAAKIGLMLILQVLSYCLVTQWTVTTGKDTLVCNPKTRQHYYSYISGLKFIV